MQRDVEGGHEEVPSRHPLAALPFQAILTFVGARRRRGPTDGERRATTMAERAPAVAHRRGLYALLTAEGVSQVGNTMVIVAGPWFVLETTDSAARTGIVSSLLEARVLVEDWRIEYNTLRPHSALGYLTPTDYAKTWTITHTALS